MAAYVIADVEETDPGSYEPASYDKYRHRVAATVAQYGGRPLVRGGAHEVVEGSWRPHRLVVLEFPSLADARRWYDSAEYRELRLVRQRSSRSNVVFVEGVQG